MRNNRRAFFFGELSRGRKRVGLFPREVDVGGAFRVKGKLSRSRPFGAKKYGSKIKNNFIKKKKIKSVNYILKIF